MNYYKSGFKNIFNYKGIATRLEFGIFLLINAIIIPAISYLLFVLFFIIMIFGFEYFMHSTGSFLEDLSHFLTNYQPDSLANNDLQKEGDTFKSMLALGIVGAIIGAIYGLLTILSIISLTVRRLHDIGYHGLIGVLIHVAIGVSFWAVNAYYGFIIKYPMLKYAFISLMIFYILFILFLTFKKGKQSL